MERVLKIRDRAQVVVDNPIITCLQASALEGSIISAIHGVPYARARGQELQQAISAVDLTDNDYTKKIHVSKEVRKEARYWTVLSMDHFVYIKPPVPTQVITTDASLDALGVELDGETTSFDVSHLGSRDDISYKELLALKCISIRRKCQAMAQPFPFGKSSNAEPI